MSVAQVARDAEKLAAVLPLVSQAVAKLQHDLEALQLRLAVRQTGFSPRSRSPWTQERLELLATMHRATEAKAMHARLSALPGDPLTLKAVKERTWKLRRDCKAGQVTATPAAARPQPPAPPAVNIKPADKPAADPDRAKPQAETRRVLAEDTQFEFYARRHNLNLAEVNAHRAKSGHPIFVLGERAAMATALDWAARSGIAPSADIREINEARILAGRAAFIINGVQCL